MTSKKKDGCKCGEICPCMDECPLCRIFEIIGGKWRVAILCSLHNDGPMRYNALKRKIHGVTNTMLAGALKELSEAGLVTRTQFPEMPVRVEYAVNPAVGELAPILRQLAKWGGKTLR